MGCNCGKNRKNFKEVLNNARLKVMSVQNNLPVTPTIIADTSTVTTNTVTPLMSPRAARALRRQERIRRREERWKRQREALEKINQQKIGPS